MSKWKRKVQVGERWTKRSKAAAEMAVERSGGWFAVTADGSTGRGRGPEKLAADGWDRGHYRSRPKCVTSERSPSVGCRVESRRSLLTSQAYL